ncbi:MAG: hypothetical protein FJ115_04115 [Deltaproteobacteria bacterium]|nr:hypothetical protein [Deltaproteobacteria bacterium]MBM4322725.1 hypothetical protein [Deltaproteobacteria bacterium]
MSNVIGIIVGVVITILGILLLICWWPMFVGVFKGILPILLILIGAGALLYFISEIKSKLDVGKEDTTTSEGSKKE